jgi:hypothetical protein
MKKQNETNEIKVSWRDAEKTCLHISLRNVSFSLGPTAACQLCDDLTFTSSFLDGYKRRSDYVWAEYAVGDISGWTISVGPVQVEISDDDAEQLRDILQVMV